MSKFRIEITLPAENDLYEIGRYISQELLKPRIARKIVENIAQAIFLLEDMPLRNAVVTDERLVSQGDKKIIVENYLVFYITDEKQMIVTIVRILFTRRDWNNIL